MKHYFSDKSKDEVNKVVTEMLVEVNSIIVELSIDLILNRTHRDRNQVVRKQILRLSHLRDIIGSMDDDIPF